MAVSQHNQTSDRIYKDVSATRKIFALKKRIRAVRGGTSSSKTVSILIWLIDYSQTTRNKLSTVTSESYPHLEKGAMLDFENIMKDAGYWNDSSWNKTKHTYTFPTGSVLEFTVFDTFLKAHGPRRDVLFINEGNNMPWNIVDQLIIRTRETIWIDWNPSIEFWFDTQILPHRKDVDFITLTYRDNEALDPVTIAEIESHRNNKNWWLIYGEGLPGVAEGRIYNNWIILDGIPDTARFYRRGLDFGYTNDPTAIVDVYQYNGGYIVDEVVYRKGLSNKTIATILNDGEPVLVRADSAEPKSIDELALYGVRIVPSLKGPGSVNQGIQYIQDQAIYVTKRSTNLLREYRGYMWLTDKEGNSLNQPQDFDNHCLDAIRYALEEYLPRNEKNSEKAKIAAREAMRRLRGL